MRCLILVALGGCGLGPPEPASGMGSAQPERPPEITLREVDFVHSRGNSVFARGHVSSLAYVRQSGETAAENATLRFPRPEHPDSAVDLSAPRAQGNPLEGRVSGQGGVHFENQQGDRGQTERASYDGKRGLASGDRAVQLFGPGFELRSPGFHWRQADDWLDLGPSDVMTTGRSK